MKKLIILSTILLTAATFGSVFADSQKPIKKKKADKTKSSKCLEKIKDKALRAIVKILKFKVENVVLGSDATRAAYTACR